MLCFRTSSASGAHCVPYAPWEGMIVKEGQIDFPDLSSPESQLFKVADQREKQRVGFLALIVGTTNPRTMALLKVKDMRLRPHA